MTLAVHSQVRADNVVYHILSASIRRRNMERVELHVSVRAMNERAYPVNFWDHTFRLEVDGVPRSPVSNLNDIVQGNSARDGEVVFVFDDTVDTLALLIGDGPNKTRVPLDLTR